MTYLTIKPHTRFIDLPTLRCVEASTPFVWLRKGWSDFLHEWQVSLPVGLVFTIAGYLIMQYALPRPYLAMTFATGFVLVAPFFAIVFYELSRRREYGKSVRLFEGLRENKASIGMFALMLAFILSSWERLSAILVALFFRGDLVADVPFSIGQLFSPEHIGFIIPYMLAGGMLAALVFALSAVSLPMLIARKVDFVTAIVTSLWVVRENPLAMLVWAFLIGALTLLGQIAWIIPLAVIFPVLGHATWHAYRDLVE
jgi:uncharacterized membrane protein